MASAVVPSGGATKRSFERGALRCLDENRFLTSIICSPSVGSVNGIQLARRGTAISKAPPFNTPAEFLDAIPRGADVTV